MTVDVFHGWVIFYIILRESVWEQYWYDILGESDNWKLKESGDDVALADCGLLLQKYLDDSNRQIDALFILADLFNRYDNNQGKGFNFLLNLFLIWF